MADESDVYIEAIRKFQKIYEEALHTELEEPTAFTLATGSPSGPSARTLLLKDASEKGFVFYTNMESRKGQQIKMNPQVAMCFFWQPLNWQITIEGEAEQVSDDEADEYWGTRPRDSQVGAWASLQSQYLPNPETLNSRVAEIEKKYANKKVPRPERWSGYRVKPNRIEFWKRGESRLHERTVYQWNRGQWSVGYLYP